VLINEVGRRQKSSAANVRPGANVGQLVGFDRSSGVKHTSYEQRPQYYTVLHADE
jgi:hypothetical protein